MPTFTYKATDAKGNVSAGQVEAGAREMAVAMLQRQGLIPIAVNEVGAEEQAAQARDVGALLGRVRRRHVTDFTSELAVLLDAGIPLEQALAIEAEQCEHEGLRGVLEKILEDVRGGLALSDAMGRHPKVFDRLYVSMIRAGEEAGAIEAVLARLSSYLERSGEIRSNVTGALAYPVLLVLLGGVSLVVLFTYLVPKFAEVFAGQEAALPALTRALLWSADVVVAYWWSGPLALLLLYLAHRRYTSAPEGRLAWDRWKLRWPVLGSLLQKAEVARIARMLETLLSGGVPVLTAINAARMTVQNAAMERTMLSLRDAVQAGKPMAGPLSESEVMPGLASRMIGLGEESGRVEQMLGKVAERYERETERQINVFVALLGPVLIVVMGLLIALVYIAMISGIFSMNSVVA